MEQELRILYLKLLKREPSSLEISNYLDDLVNNQIRLEDIEVIIRDTLEYKRTEKDYYGELRYDRTTYIMELNELNENNYDGVILANGKICVKTSSRPFETDKSLITINYEFDNVGRYNNNILNGFKYTDIHFFGYGQPNVEMEEYKQSLNMYNATFTQSYKLRNGSTEYIGVTKSMVALQQYPYCFLQKYSIENLSIDSEAEIDMFHILSHLDNISESEYYNDMIDDAYMFSGIGTDKERDILVFTNSTYLLDTGVRVEGYERIDTRIGSNKIKVRIDPGSTKNISIISGMMSSSDFPNPKIELTRILLNIRKNELKLEHNKKWIEIWETADIQISQKTNIESDELEDANKDVEDSQRNIKYSLYNVFSIIRDDVNVDINTLNLSAIDLNGDIFWNAEMFLIPVLIMMRPKCARVLLDFRYRQLENARNLALAYGNKGSQYPYKNDTMYYKDVYWNSSSPVYAFNTGLIAINVWNYYRITLDKYWLHEKGFPILQNSARFFQSLFDSNYDLKEVYTLNNKIERNNIFTRYIAINTLKHYREACLELSFIIPLDINILYKNVYNSMDSIAVTKNVNMTVSIPIRVLIKDDNNIINFYNYETEELIGGEFGGYTGKQMLINGSQDYEFHITKDTYVKLYDVMNNEIKEYDGSALYSSEYGLTEGYIIIKEGDIASYANLYKRDYVFGKNAFVKIDDNVLHNIIESDETNNIIESHIMLMTYYSKTYLNKSNMFNKADIIQDNLMYYNLMNPNSDNTVNKHIQSNLECLLAQDMGLRTAREYYINKYEKTMFEIYNSPEVKMPWVNHNNHAFVIFNILTSMIKLRIRGEISDRKFYIENFGIDHKTGYIYPKYWNKIIVNYNDKVLTLINSI